MRVPDTIRDCVCFLCVPDVHSSGDHRRYIYGGTAFFVSVSSKRAPLEYIYLVTARHCVEDAKQYGTSIFVRLNTVTGAGRILETRGEWLYPEDESIDVAAIACAPDHRHFAYMTIPESMFATEEIVSEHRIGIGDDVVIAGLFTQRHGQERNLPIVRSGIVASMPDEHLIDSRSGLPYHAFLIEARSIGGLSGSPVFAVLTPGRDADGTLKGEGAAFLLGFVRGHWDYPAPPESLAFSSDESRMLNMGIATATPIIELQQLLYSEELIRKRNRWDMDYIKSNAPTPDASFRVRDSGK